MEQSEKPQHLDQSNKVFWHRACNWTKDFSVSSKERRFLSVQTIHIKQPGTIFQISELNLTPAVHQAFQGAWWVSMRWQVMENTCQNFELQNKTYMLPSSSWYCDWSLHDCTVLEMVKNCKKYIAINLGFINISFI